MSCVRSFRAEVQAERGRRAEYRVMDFLQDYFRTTSSSVADDLYGIDVHCSYYHHSSGGGAWDDVEADLQVKSMEHLRSGKVHFYAPFPGMLSHYRDRVHVILFVIGDRSEIYALPMHDIDTLSAQMYPSLKELDRQHVNRYFSTWDAEFERRGLKFQFGERRFISFINRQLHRAAGIRRNARHTEEWW